MECVGGCGGDSDGDVARWTKGSDDGGGGGVDETRRKEMELEFEDRTKLVL